MQEEMLVFFLDISTCSPGIEQSNLGKRGSEEKEVEEKKSHAIKNKQKDDIDFKEFTPNLGDGAREDFLATTDKSDTVEDSTDSSFGSGSGKAEKVQVDNEEFDEKEKDTKEAVDPESAEFEIKWMKDVAKGINKKLLSSEFGRKSWKHVLHDHKEETKKMKPESLKGLKKYTRDFFAEGAEENSMNNEEIQITLEERKREAKEDDDLTTEPKATRDEYKEQGARQADH